MAEKNQTPGAGEAKVPGPSGNTRTIQVVEFLLGKEHYAIDLFDVREVVEYTTITKLPNTPPFVKGIIDLRGEVTMILDLKERLGLPPTENTEVENTRVIVLDDTKTSSKIGILVDDVLSVSHFEQEHIDKVSISDSAKESAIRGIIKKKVQIRNKETSVLIIWIDILPLLQDIGI
ncbi:MAG: chemotaxis protein CheW [Methanoregulaceae archaeon]